MFLCLAKLKSGYIFYAVIFLVCGAHLFIIILMRHHLTFSTIIGLGIVKSVSSQRRGPSTGSRVDVSATFLGQDSTTGGFESVKTDLNNCATNLNATQK